MKCLKCIAPPLTWLFGGAEISDEDLEKIKSRPVNVFLTFNNQEWIAAREFKYHDWRVDRIAYCQNFGNEIPDLTERDRVWRSEEPIE
jgi:hypothetical protein